MTIARRKVLLLGGAAAVAGVAPAAELTAAAAPAAPRRSALVRYAPDGSPAWTRALALGQDESAGGLVIGGGFVVVAQHRALRAFSIATGTPVWTAPYRGIGYQLLAADGLVLLQVTNDAYSRPRIIAHDQRTGAHRWTHDPRTDFVLLYPLRPGSVIVQARDETVVLDTATGRIRWRAPTPNRGADDGSATQIASSDSVVLQGGRSTAVALDAGTGRRLWARTPPIGPAFPYLTGSVALLTPTTGGGDQPGGVLAFDARTGAPRWTVPAADESGSVVAAGHGVVVAMTGGTVQGGRTTAVAAATGRVLWSVPIPAASADDAPTAITSQGVAYVEDLWHDGPSGQHRSINLVNRRLRDGRVLYRRPLPDVITQGEPSDLSGPYLPLLLLDREGVRIRLFDLRRHRVAFTVRPPHFPTSTPIVLGNGSVLSLTADLQVGITSQPGAAFTDRRPCRIRTPWG